MQKKIIALAIASAISAPAFAENANITFYGKIITDVESVSSDKSTVPASAGGSYTVNRVVSNTSRLGLKGENDLGDGMHAWYQYETNVNLTNTDAAIAGTSATTVTPSTGTATATTTTTTNVGLFDGVRNSAIGIKAEDFGNLSMGNWDTPYKLTHNAIELFDNTTFASATNVIGRTGAVAVGTNAAAASNFVVRQAGVIQYWSPKMLGGFDVKVAYAPAATTFDSTRKLSQNKNLFSASATYEVEGLYAAVAYENHNDALTPSTTTTGGNTGADTAMRLVLKANIDASLWIGATIENISVSAANSAKTGVVQVSRMATELAANYKMGAQNIGLSYAAIGDMTNSADTGATQVSLRYSYDYSKRTQAFAMYSSLANKANGQYGLSAGQNLTSAAGATLSGLGFGLQHSF